MAYDELDLPPGVARLKQGGGHGGHNGLRDIFRHTVDHNFLRLRIGIGHPGTRDAVTGYVLSRANAEQELLIFSALDRALAVLPDLLDGDLADAMKELHTMNEDGIGANGL
jgi:PTH1 family peptidyl-tRNA hydrolase